MAQAQSPLDLVYESAASITGESSARSARHARADGSAHRAVTAR
jgi:hypothetical protein